MIRRKKGSIEWLEFELFANHPNLIHAVFLRHGGVSTGVCSSLNANYKRTGDSHENVRENKSLMQDVLKLEHLISIDAVHGINIESVNEPQEEIPNCDGLTTNRKNWGLLTTHADCQTAIFYDPVQQALSNVHAGWRGQVGDIYSQTINKMCSTYGSKAKDILVAIAPSLGPQNAEFIHYRTEFPQEFWSFQVKPNHFNLWDIARFQLEKCGIQSQHIQIAEIDTFANPADFFSYRRGCKASGKNVNVTGCHATVAALR